MLRGSDKKLLLGHPGQPRMRRPLGAVIQGLRPTKHASSASSVFGTQLTANASANTKATTYTEVIAAADFDADGFYLHLSGLVTVRDYLVDVAIGVSSSEVNILNNFLYSTGVGFREHNEVYVPLPIAAGTRVSARCQSSSGSATIHIAIALCRGPHYAARRKSVATTYGANTGDSGGTQIDPGGAANTWGSYVQVDAAVAHRLDYAIICHGNAANTTRTPAGMLWQLGVGAALSEVAVTAPLLGAAESGNDIIRPYTHERGVSIPAGSRLAVRAQCEITDATDRLTDIAIVGFS